MTQEEAPTRPPTRTADNFAEIADEFNKRVARIVWCTVATVDTKGHPRTRILHPIWETAGAAPVGYIATGRHSLKEKHLAANANISITYWDPAHEQVYVEATGEWDDDPAERRRIWELFKNTPPPLGYDPGLIWRDGPDGDDYGLLKLIPRRVELYGIADLMAGRGPLIWRR